jgi:3-hydroxyacyl-CoA dehydrogenase
VRRDVRVSSVDRVGIIGAGLMGRAIAAAHTKHFLPVVLNDTNAEALGRARHEIVTELENGLAGRQAGRLSDHLLFTSQEEGPLKVCDLVVESIPERLQAKQQLFSRLQSLLPGRVILASNTSTIPVSRLASPLTDRRRFCGLHFCHPVHARPLVEVVRGPETSDGTVATIVAHAQAIGKIPLVVQDGPGFVVNRLLLPYLSEAVDLLLEGASPGEVDQAMTSFGMSLGPIEMLDEIGLDTALQAALVLSETCGERIVPSPLVVGLVKAGQLGKKSVMGIYDWAGIAPLPDPKTNTTNRYFRGAKGTSTPLLRELLGRWNRPARHHSPASIQYRLLLPMVLEATRILEEGKVEDCRDVDLAVLFGLGFPAHRGGLLWWADSLGANQILDHLKPLESLGPRMHPTPRLVDFAGAGASFYSAGVRV